MADNISLRRQIDDAQATIHVLHEELAETNRGLLALTMELERRVEARIAELQAANRELEAFSYAFSHDLRVPLRHIGSFSQILLEDYADVLDQTGKEYVTLLISASAQMAQLIDDLLRLSRVTHGEIFSTPADLSDLARTVTEKLAKSTPERIVTVAIAEGLVVQGDARLLRIVLENLLGNAWKFTSTTPDARIEVGMTPHQGIPTYFVRDNGAGFDMSHADKLFIPFQRLHLAAEFEGTGIGLATVQRVINRHGGKVWAEGIVGQGATFYFTLGNVER
jgi:light-regulated signal transduction histidine kinase (bacteriophytochrome)